MAFLYSCCIHNSTPSLWRLLIALGLRQDSSMPKLEARTLTNPMCIVTINGTFFTMKQEDALADVYDCGINERLFLALALMRDDSDIHQWFIYDNRHWNEQDPKRFWFQCKVDDVCDYITDDAMLNDCEKATKQEIISHFSGRDDDEEI